MKTIEYLKIRKGNPVAVIKDNILEQDILYFDFLKKSAIEDFKRASYKLSNKIHWNISNCILIFFVPEKGLSKKDTGILAEMAYIVKKFQISNGDLK